MHRNSSRNETHFIDLTIAEALDMDAAEVSSDMAYHMDYRWDSINQVRLLTLLERDLDCEISDDQLLELKTVRAIRAFADSTMTVSTTTENMSNPERIDRGLDGVLIDYTTITGIDGKNGKLYHRGYPIEDLVENASFEQVSYLFLQGTIPNAVQLAGWHKKLGSTRSLPASVSALVASLKDKHPMDTLQAGLSYLLAVLPSLTDEDLAVELIGKIPLIVATHQAARKGREVASFLPVDPHGKYVARLMCGSGAGIDAMRIIEQDLIVHADHSSNASSFAARVAGGAGANLGAATLAALATFGGKFHGGAAEAVLAKIDEVGCPSQAQAYVDGKLNDGKPIMGFGHRIYKTVDPRVAPMRRAAESLAATGRSGEALQVVAALRTAMAPYSRLGLDANVDLYAGIIYRQLGLDDDLAVPMFVMGRIVGWAAQYFEQLQNNVLIRPRLAYQGPTDLRLGRDEACTNG